MHMHTHTHTHIYTVDKLTQSMIMQRMEHPVYFGPITLSDTAQPCNGITLHIVEGPTLKSIVSMWFFFFFKEFWEVLIKSMK